MRGVSVCSGNVVIAQGTLVIRAAEQVGVFIPIGNNGWLISKSAPQYMPTFELNKQIVRKAEEHGVAQPTARQVFDWVCEVRRAKLPDPAVIGNAGSFFKNPTVSAEQCADIIARDPHVVHYPLPDGSVKLAAGWLIDSCGWKGKSVGLAGVHERQALVLVNRGGVDQPVTGGEVMTLAKAIQTSVYERFGIRLEPEPVVV